MDDHSSQFKRGARRKKTLKLILEETPLTPKEKEDLSNLFTVMMGIEPLIVTKDVCGLNNQESSVRVDTLITPLAQDNRTRTLLNATFFLRSHILLSTG